ncbi:transcriptional regulator [Bacillus oleivorans]|uniref:Transcriptional regulator n=1 Tax=Bacillus oleivorans TaxID=1448271 RepID=A0A285CYP5_9BACI|nr:DUF2087 domain-containing protein [Bacillus oleivorans]SNX72659.1 transcriptional regulator [Bacillus oleivorans]
MNGEELFWSASVEELAQGYIFKQDTGEYVCLICNKGFEDGIIYPVGELFFEARKAIEQHIKDVHHSMFDYLVKMGKKYTGLSDHQKELLVYFKQGLSDKEIVRLLKGGSTSTIRNHRFKLKEKEKQAKVFLALMGLLKTEKDESAQEFITFHKGAKMVDDRYAITKEEKEKVLATYFKQGPDGPLDTFPSKEKRKIIVLQQILKRFDVNKKYTEREVNEVIKTAHPDFATIRRYFIEYGFMDRNKECTQYWVKQ